MVWVYLYSFTGGKWFMNKLISSCALIIILLLSACSENSSKTSNETPILVDAQIIIPGKISINKSNELTVILTQGSENVEDANEVQFEIWKGENKEESELIDAKHEKSGKYTVKKTFKEGGLYYVQTHVTARGMHVMPTKPFIVGIASEEELIILEKELQEQESTENNSNSHHH